LMIIIYMLYRCFYFFFFSSRRRHTRLQGDWSSDVCSSDLRRPCLPLLLSCEAVSKAYGTRSLFDGLTFGLFEGDQAGLVGPNGRSEERRVGKGVDRGGGRIINKKKKYG